jgi:hypothetical protein
MALIAQIALDVIIGGLTTALLVTGFFVWIETSRLAQSSFRYTSTAAHLRQMR